MRSASQKYSYVYGITAAALMIVFFLLMRLLNLHKVFELRYVNILFLFLGHWLAFRKLKKMNISMEYLKGLVLGFKITFIATIIFTAFVAIYLQAIDPGFMEFIKENVPNGKELSFWMLGAILFSELLSSGIIIDLILLHYYKG